jgi:quinoprotein glucose dehydrogenase
VPGTDGKLASLWLPNHIGGSNWPGGAFDPETGIMYVSSITNPDSVGVQKGDPKRTDMAYVAVLGAHPGAPAGAVQTAAPPAAGEASGRPSFGPRGLPLVRPPWGRITAIDLNTGDHVWMIANGEAPDIVKNNPALKGLNLDLSKAGKPERSPLLVTKTLLFGADGSGLFSSGPGSGGPMFRAIDKKTGAIVHEMKLPASTTGIPMTYMADGRQFIVVAVGARGVPAELIALALP